jgi:hypothetical protein|tara:strand:- start:1388 stop:2023 length:636 start_codon:yes stop_codon:yes gene_type:complete
MDKRWRSGRMMYIGEVPKSISEPCKARLLHNSYWPWYINTETTSYDTNFATSIPDEVSGEDPQFLHTCINTLGEIVSPDAYEKVCEPVWKWIVSNTEMPEFDSFRRIKINLLPRRETKHLYHTPHVDFDQPHWTIIYYVNDSDGPTIFFKQKYDGHKQKLELKQKVEPRQGRFVLFDGLHYHTSSNPQYNDWRCVINFNFISVSSENLNEN